MENINVDKEGYLRNLDDWTESAAQNLAAGEGKLIGSHRCLGGERRRTDDEGKFHGLLLRSLIGLKVILAKEKAPGKLG